MSYDRRARAHGEDPSWPYSRLRDGGPPRRPLSVVRYWLPGLAAATVILSASLAADVVFGGVGWTVTALPIAFGATLGYALPFRLATGLVVAALAYVGAVIGVATIGVAGLFCAVALLVTGTIPTLVGMALGVALRNWAIRRDRWYHVRYLPVLFAAAVLSWPVAALEAHLTPRHAATTVETSAIVDADLRDVWSAHVFDDAHAAPASRLAVVGLPAPAGATGHALRVGDVKTIRLGKGVVQLRVTEAAPPYGLAYEVITQRGFEDRTLRLIGGEGRLTETADGRTRVTVRTHYEPLLDARAVWAPIERLVAGELHLHLLREIQRVVTDPDAAKPASDALDQ